MDPLEMAVNRAASLGSVERAYADGYAAARHEIERLRTVIKKALPNIRPSPAFAESLLKDALEQKEDGKLAAQKKVIRFGKQ